jgi:hypothetical protein
LDLVALQSHNTCYNEKMKFLPFSSTVSILVSKPIDKTGLRSVVYKTPSAGILALVYKKFYSKNTF